MESTIRRSIKVKGNYSHFYKRAIRISLLHVSFDNPNLYHCLTCWCSESLPTKEDPDLFLFERGTDWELITNQFYGKKSFNKR